MKKMFFGARAAIAASLILATGLVACGSGDSGSAGARSSDSPSTSVAQAPSGLADVSALARAWSTKTAKIGYSFQVITAGEAAETVTKYTIYRMPPSSSRWDIEATGNTSIIISDGDKGYYCFQGTCVENQANATNPIEQMPFFGWFGTPTAISDQLAAFAGIEAETHEETLAGVDSTCFTYSMGRMETASTVELCMSEDGLVTRVRSTSGAQGSDEGFLLEATEVSSEVSASDFDPPYRVVRL